MGMVGARYRYGGDRPERGLRLQRSRVLRLSRQAGYERTAHLARANFAPRARSQSRDAGAGDLMFFQDQDEAVARRHLSRRRPVRARAGERPASGRRKHRLAVLSRAPRRGRPAAGARRDRVGYRFPPRSAQNSAANRYPTPISQHRLRGARSLPRTLATHVRARAPLGACRGLAVAARASRAALRPAQASSKRPRPRASSPPSPASELEREGELARRRGSGRENALDVGAELVGRQAADAGRRPSDGRAAAQGGAPTAQRRRHADSCAGQLRLARVARHARSSEPGRARQGPSARRGPCPRCAIMPRRQSLPVTYGRFCTPSLGCARGPRRRYDRKGNRNGSIGTRRPRASGSACSSRTTAWKPSGCSPCISRVTAHPRESKTSSRHLLKAQRRRRLVGEPTTTAPQGDINGTVECYAALRCVGMSPDDEPLVRARRWIFEHGGLRGDPRVHALLARVARRVAVERDAEPAA